MGELQTLTNIITNMLVMKNKQKLCEDEYMFYLSCLNVVKTHNRLRRFALQQEHKARKHAIVIDNKALKHAIVIDKKVSDDEKASI